MPANDKANAHNAQETPAAAEMPVDTSPAAEGLISEEEATQTTPEEPVKRALTDEEYFEQMEPVTRDITSCAACGSKHSDMEFVPTPPRAWDNKSIPEWIVICPTTKRPVYLKGAAAYRITLQGAQVRLETFYRDVINNVLSNYEQDVAKYPLGADDPGLVCYGCAHAASVVPFPGLPSGETACVKCTRNEQREDGGKATDNYLSVNMLDKLIDATAKKK